MAADGDLEAAEKFILCWDTPADDRMLFDGPDRSDADRFLLAVDDLLRASSLVEESSPDRSPNPSSSANNTIQIAMLRLEDEFRHILVTRATDLEIDTLIDLSSLSMASNRSIDLSGEGSDPEDEGGSLSANGSGEGSSSISYRTVSCVREVDLVPPDAIHDLRSIAERMIASGSARALAQAYSSARKPAVELALRQLGVEKLSISDVHRLEWDALESKIRRWIRTARISTRLVFSSERRLADLIFDGAGDAAGDIPFNEAVKSSAIQLLSFPEAISIGRRSPEKLFKILDLHDAIKDLLPDIAAIFRSKSSESLYTQAEEIVGRLAEAVRGILSEFENAVLRDPSKIPVPGGTIHPLTRYVMNYLSLTSDYKQTLNELIVSKPSTVARVSEDEQAPEMPEIEFPDFQNMSPLASHLLWIIVILHSNVEIKASLYKDSALSNLFLMNNLHYIVHKVKGSPELRESIGDDYLKRLTAKFRQLATGYQRATWVKVLNCLRDEGIHVSGSFSSAVSKSMLRERFKSFNAAFDEVHRVQAMWLVPDTQLREELRILISERLVPAYRSFLGRFRHHIESGRHPELYIKYTVEDLEAALSDFFEGCPTSLHGRRRSH